MKGKKAGRVVKRIKALNFSRTFFTGRAVPLPKNIYLSLFRVFSNLWHTIKPTMVRAHLLITPTLLNVHIEDNTYLNVSRRMQHYYLSKGDFLFSSACFFTRFLFFYHFCSIVAQQKVFHTQVSWGKKCALKHKNAMLLQKEFHLLCELGEYLINYHLDLAQ